MAEERGNEEAKAYLDHTERTRKGFNKRFWNPDVGYLFDVVDVEQGDDAACRLNQIFAISLTTENLRSINQ